MNRFSHFLFDIYAWDL